MHGAVPSIDGIPNPLSWAAGQAAGSAFDAACQAVWNFATGALAAAFTVVGATTTPDLSVTGSGPLAKVYPITLWLGLLVALVLSFVSVGRIIYDGGRGIGLFLKGIAQYAVLSAASLSMLVLLVQLAGSLSTGILTAGLKVDDWSGIGSGQSWLEGAARSVSSAGLGVLAVFGLLPAAFGFVIESLIRMGAIEILAATIPILLAGLLAAGTRRWFWLGLRWMMALVFMPVAVALALSIGAGLALAGSSAGGGDGSGSVEAVAQALVGAMTMVLALFTPFALFKMFAFMEPNTMGGTFSMPFGLGSSKGSGQAPAQDSDEAAESANMARMSLAGVMVGTAGADAAASVGSRSASSLDRLGAGHPGGPQQGGSGDRSEGSGRDDATSDAEPSSGSGSPPDPEADGTTDVPPPPMPPGPTSEPPDPPGPSSGGPAPKASGGAAGAEAGAGEEAAVAAAAL